MRAIFPPRSSEERRDGSLAPVFSSSLALFVLGVHANHPHYTLAMNDLALVTNFLNRCAYLHNSPNTLPLRFCQNPGTILADHDAVLEVGGITAVLGHGSPLIFQY